MKTIWLVSLLFSGSFLLAQDSTNTMSHDSAKVSKGEVTVRGCVSRASGDYILMKQDPGVTYEPQATGKIKLSRYLGQRVEVSGKQSPSLSTSSDAIERTAPSPVTLTISSIKTISKECTERPVNNQ